jgi:hypothetical protein
MGAIDQGAIVLGGAIVRGIIVLDPYYIHITHYCQVTHADIKISMYHGVQNTI